MGPMDDATPLHYGGDAGDRPVKQAVARGAAKRCPSCGRGRLFKSYIETADYCSHCGLDFSGHQADDAPPYLTILIVGHVTIPTALAVKQIFDPPIWFQFSFWGPAILLATFWLLPICKGGLIGLQWANRMHGFAKEDEGDADDTALDGG